MADLLDAVEPKPLKIISLVAENVKKITALNITPDGNVVQITGKNGSGKTSTLNSIWWALAGAGNVQSAPIRKGQDRAVIKLDLGEVIVTRTFTKRDDDSAGTTITVENAEGARFPSPQRMLDSLLGSLTFDPLAFARMKAKDQFDALKRFVPDIDFSNIEGLNRSDFDKRTAVNKRAKDLAAQASAIAIPESAPADKVDEEALIKEIGEVGEFNAEIERRAERRIEVTGRAIQHRKDAEGHRTKAIQLRADADEQDRLAEHCIEVATSLEEKLATAEALPAKKDAAEVKARLDRAKAANAAVDRMAQRAKLLADADVAKKESETITARMDKREEDKRAAIAAAKLPVDGLGFGDDAITLNGLPFDQASDAEKLRTSIAIAMAANPKLRVILVRDASLLDEDGMRLVAEMADAHDCQVWLESVNSSGNVGIVMEDGHVASTPATRRAARQQAAE